MPEINLHNRSMAYFGAGQTRTLVTRRIGGGVVGISRVRFDGEGPAPVAPPEPEDALLLHFHLRPQIAEMSLDGRSPAPLRTPAGQINILDFRQRLGGRIFDPFDMVGFHLPFAAFDRLGPDYGNRRLDGISLGAFDSRDDPQVRGLAMSLLPLFEREEEASPLFLDHVGWALVAHIGQRYGEFRPGAADRSLGLAGWQWRRVTDMIDADLSGRLRLADLAAICDLPVARFTRAFRATAGLAPYQWLQQRRVDRAKDMLLSTDMPLSQIASECGFSDQSHLTRVFGRAVGTSPGRWRNRN